MLAQDTLPELFNFSDGDKLCAFSDSVRRKNMLCLCVHGCGLLTHATRVPCSLPQVLPAVLRKLGVLVYSGELTDQVDAGTPLPAGSTMEVELRAATVTAVADMVAALARDDVNAVKLSLYLWALRKQEQYRASKRHATPGIVWY